jgi:hypothetical protein
MPSASLTRRGLEDVAIGRKQMLEGLRGTIKSVAEAISPSLGAHIAPPEDVEKYAVSLGVKQPSLLDHLIQGAAQYAPFGVGGEALAAGKGLGFLGRTAAQSAAGAAFGGTQVPYGTSGVDRAVSAGIGGALGGAGELAGAGISALSPTAMLRKIGERAVTGAGGIRTPKKVAQMSQNIGDAPVTIGDVVNYGPLARFNKALSVLPFSGVNKDASSVIQAIQNKATPAVIEMLGESKPGTITDDLRSAVNKIYKSNKSAASDKFNDVMAEADARGIKPYETDAYNIPTGNTNLQKSARTFLLEGTKGLPPIVAKKLGNYEGRRSYSNPPYRTFKQAHALNSSLGTTARDLRTSGNANGARIVTQLQEALQQDIDKTLSNSGHKDILDAWKDARRDWASNVVPFQKKTLANQLSGEADAGNLYKTLTANKESMRKVLNQLPQDVKNKISYHFIPKSTNVSSADEITPLALESGYKSMKKSTRDNLLTPDQVQNRAEMKDLIDASGEARLSLNQPATGYRSAGVIKAIIMGALGGAGVTHGASPEELALILGGVAGVGRGIQKALTSKASRDMYINAATKTGLLESLGRGASRGLQPITQPANTQLLQGKR